MLITEPRPLRRVGAIVVVLLGADIVLSWAVLQGISAYLELVWQGVARAPLPHGGLPAHRQQFHTVRVLEAVGWTLTALAFLTWLSRAQANAGALGEAAPGVSPRRAVASFFLKLVGPAGVLSHLCGGRGEPVPSAGSPRVAMVAWWWSLLLATGLGQVTVLVLTGRSGSPLDLGGPLQILALTELVQIAAAAVAIAMVRRITVRQEKPSEARHPSA